MYVLYFIKYNKNIRFKNDFSDLCRIIFIDNILIEKLSIKIRHLQINN